MAKVTVSGSSSSNRRLTEQGLVSIDEYQGRLRLRFRYGGKRCAISVGLPDSAVNRRVAQQKATQIELDIASGNFDPTLAKYKPAKGDRAKDTTQVVNVFEQFMTLKVENKVLGQGSLARYRAVLKYLRAFFKDAAAEQKSAICTPDDLVFPAPKGDTISDFNFRRRAWKNMLEKLDIDYRKPYATRHTAISHALANGANPMAVAEQTGHDPQILFKHYASAI